MNLYREGAKTCSAACRKRASRAAKLPRKMLNSGRFVRYTSSKRPVTVAGTSASSTNPETWTDYETAKAATVGRGVGIVLGDNLGCIDLDHCMVDGDLLPWAAEVVAANPNTYIEVSMSGEGLHIFGLLEEAKGTVIKDGRNIEIYSRERYIALTENVFPGSKRNLAPLNVGAL